MEMKFVKIPAPDFISGCAAYREPNRGFTLFITMENGKMHCSLAHPKRWPSWDELKWVRYNYMKHCKYVAQILPPETEYTNIHENCFHLWELTEADFGR